MKKKTIVWTSGVLVLLIIGLIFYNNLSPEISKDDVFIASEIQKLDKDMYLVELKITRTKKEMGSNFIYPEIQGLGNLSFKTEDNLYSPSSIGTDSESYTLLNNEINDDQIKPAKIGFSIPGDVGTYKMKFTLSNLEGFQILTDPSVYYVHKEEWFGKKLSWIIKSSIKTNE
jgi:hypothetical protein